MPEGNLFNKLSMMLAAPLDGKRNFLSTKFKPFKVSFSPFVQFPTSQKISATDGYKCPAD